MTPPWAQHHGDVLDVLRTLPSAAFDAMLTDPPYGYKFMGKKWDYDVPSVEAWREVLRVLKPGAFALVACGTRTQHRMVVNLEDAGFEVRDVICWHYASGFPKSLDISKAIDKAAGAEREAVGVKAVGSGNGRGPGFRHDGDTDGVPVTVPATEDARTWNGYGTALKPATEFYTLIRKPTDDTYAENALAHGCGALNLDGARVSFVSDADRAEAVAKNAHSDFGSGAREGTVYGEFNADRTNWNPDGRFPANLILDEHAAALLDAQSGSSTSRKGAPRTGQNGQGWGMTATGAEYDDVGGASRFFYCAKASRAERDAGITGDGQPFAFGNQAKAALARGELDFADGKSGMNAVRVRRNHHPTVKPLDLCRYLATLLLPPRRDSPRRLLVPFSGSGSEMIGALLAGWDHVTGIERDAEYQAIAEARLQHWTATPTLLSLF